MAVDPVEELLVPMPYVGLDIEGTESDSVRVEYNPNRPDYSTDYGIARALRGLVGKELGVKKPVLAWGCGLDRLLMLRMGLEDIRELYNNDIEWLRERKEIAGSQD